MSPFWIAPIAEAAVLDLLDEEAAVELVRGGRDVLGSHWLGFQAEDPVDLLGCVDRRDG